MSVNLLLCLAGLPNSMMADNISRHALATSMPTEPSNYVVPTMGLHTLPTLPHQLPLLPHVSTVYLILGRYTCWDTRVLSSPLCTQKLPTTSCLKLLCLFWNIVSFMLEFKIQFSSPALRKMYLQPCVFAIGRTLHFAWWMAIPEWMLSLL